MTAARSRPHLGGAQVHHLAAGHARRAGRAGKLGDQLGADERILVRRLVGEHLERQGMERIAGEDRGRFLEGAMQGRLAAPQIVVVHARQIVVDQRIDVDAFDRERDAHRSRRDRP